MSCRHLLHYSGLLVAQTAPVVEVPDAAVGDPCEVTGEGLFIADDQVDLEAGFAKPEGGEGEDPVAGTNHCVVETACHLAGSESSRDVVDEGMVGSVGTCGEADRGRRPQGEEVVLDDGPL